MTDEPVVVAAVAGQACSVIGTAPAIFLRILLPKPLRYLGSSLMQNSSKSVVPIAGVIRLDVQLSRCFVAKDTTDVQP